MLLAASKTPMFGWIKLSKAEKPCATLLLFWHGVSLLIWKCTYAMKTQVNTQTQTLPGESRQMAMSSTCSSSCRLSFFRPTWNFTNGSSSSRVCPAMKDDINIQLVLQSQLHLHALGREPKIIFYLLMNEHTLLQRWAWKKNHYSLCLFI